MEQKGNDQQGDKPTKRPADEGVAGLLSNKERKSDSGRSTMECESKPVFDKPTLDSISTNRQALEVFVDCLQTKIVEKYNFNLLGLLVTASVRLERLLLDGTLFLE